MQWRGSPSQIMSLQYTARVRRYLYASRIPILSFTFVFGFSVLRIIRSWYTLSSIIQTYGEDMDQFNQQPSRHFWEQTDNPTCFHLDRICHGNDEWFYDSSNVNLAASHRLHQPTISYSDKKVPNTPDKRYYFNVSSAPRSNINTTMCPYSSTPYHLVVQSDYNDMIGEFYSRTVRGLNEWMRDFPPQSDDELQLYIHFTSEGRQTLFEGHRLFLGALPQNDNVDSFISLIQDERCQCLKKLIFCGYKHQRDNQTFHTVGDIFHQQTYKSCDRRGFRKGNKCTAYNNLRQDLLARYEKKDPMLQQKCRDYRRQILFQNGVASESIGNVDEWRIVGLTDRKSRRVWLNIDDAINSCEQFLRRKVMCIKVNVEEADTVEQQLLMHMSLNALVGIHGAQLTHAVLLPEERFVLEILPWIPRNITDWGDWTDRVSSPTPLGEIFHNTNLHHVGYRLGRESVPLCEHLEWADKDLKACLLNETNGNDDKFNWETRDFNVEEKVVTTFISSFLLNSIPNCKRMQEGAEESGFVLYNAFCSKKRNKMKRAKHYFLHGQDLLT